MRKSLRLRAFAVQRQRTRPAGSPEFCRAGEGSLSPTTLLLGRREGSLECHNEASPLIYNTWSQHQAARPAPRCGKPHFWHACPSGRGCIVTSSCSEKGGVDGRLEVGNAERVPVVPRWRTVRACRRRGRPDDGAAPGQKADFAKARVSRAASVLLPFGGSNRVPRPPTSRSDGEWSDRLDRFAGGSLRATRPRGSQDALDLGSNSGSTLRALNRLHRQNDRLPQRLPSLPSLGPRVTAIMPWASRFARWPLPRGIRLERRIGCQAACSARGRRGTARPVLWRESKVRGHCPVRNQAGNNALPGVPAHAEDAAALVRRVVMDRARSPQLHATRGHGPPPELFEYVGKANPLPQSRQAQIPPRPPNLPGTQRGGTRRPRRQPQVGVPLGRVLSRPIIVRHGGPIARSAGLLHSTGHATGG